VFTAKTTLAWLFLYAIAMANIEAAIVVHLRSLYYPANPLEIFPLNLMTHRDLAIELSRELATVVMIIAVAVLAERQIVRRFAAFVFVFGMWDIFYYAWLKIMIGWPVSWGEWDVLFLIPWPWLGPWITPALIALLFTAWSSRILLSSDEYLFSKSQLLIFMLGALLGLASFMLPAAHLLADGEQAFQGYQPGSFNWGLYTTGFILMATSLFRVLKNKPL
jgi:hypothetical protein